MYDYHPDLVLILFSRSHPYIPLHFDEMFFTTSLVRIHFFMIAVHNTVTKEHMRVPHIDHPKSVFENFV